MQLNKERISLEPIVRRYEGQETLKSNHSRRSLSINPKIKTYNLKGRNIPFINHCKPSSIRSIN